MNKEPSEIAKLTERISKDPKSKLFVPLAEEYKKDGDVEMAIHVLSEGLKHNPGYVTARSILGRLLFDKGDYEGARREFEEVVKAIPDNLLAQKKLGDVYALKNSNDEALNHYKIAAALNPGDEELSLLMADIEAGRDVHARILQQKPRTPSETAAGRDKQQPPSVKPKAKPEVSPLPESPRPTVKVAQAATAPKPGPVPGEAAQPVSPAPESPDRTALHQKTGEEKVPAGKPEIAVPQQPEPSAPTAISGAESVDLLQVSEEPEEILFVEPLEEEAQAKQAEEQTVSALDTGVLESFEPAPESAELQAAEGTADLSEILKADTEIFSDASLAGMIDETSSAEAELIQEPSVLEPAAGEESTKTDQSDDFTTDTLAELYIAQGFFEKAIDIYQRMMADHPTSQALKDKLARVREMAGTSEVPQEEKQESATPAGKVVEDETATEEFFTARPPVEAEQTPGKAEADIFGEAVEYVPPPTVPEAEDEVLTVDAVEVDEGQPARFESHAAPASEAVPAEEDLTLDAEVFVEHEEPTAPEKAAGGTAADTVFTELEESAPQEIAPKVSKQAGFAEEGSGEASFDIFMTAPAPKPGVARPLYTDFEPREYVPPTAEPAEPAGQTVQAAQAPSIASRKETIDRLENWLKNIRKEK